MKNLTKKILSNANSLRVATILLAISVCLVLFQPYIPTLTELQRQSGYKKISGYILVILFILLWMSHFFRQYFSDHKQREIIRVFHQWFGATTLFVLMLHASLVKTGFLGILMWVLFANCLTGIIIGLEQNWRYNLRRWILLVHICLSFAASMLALIHLYFVFAYRS